MARKVRRVKSPPARAASPEPVTPTTPPTPPREEALREEYGYVLKDLRQIAILAAALFLLLIVLNLLL
ncbi:MAG: hypothetical protein GX579_09650 [Chloroflexi bacterium]|jgi:hypothetical protein|nr:hypothetical protein [Chloroflexota bacterium]